MKNEGYKRLLMIIIIFCYFYLFYFMDHNIRPRDFGIDTDIGGLIFILSVPLLLTLFSFGFVIKTFHWVKDGFKR